MRIYERIFEYIRLSKNLRMNIRIYSYWGNGTNTNTNNIWGPFYSNIWIFEYSCYHWFLVCSVQCTIWSLQCSVFVLPKYICITQDIIIFKNLQNFFVRFLNLFCPTSFFWQWSYSYSFLAPAAFPVSATLALLVIVPC